MSEQNTDLKSQNNSQQNTAFYTKDTVQSMERTQEQVCDTIRVRSDGIIENWQEGMQLCQHFLGYGEELCLDEEPIVV